MRDYWYFYIFICIELSANSTTIITSTRVINITSSTVLKDNHDNSDSNNREIENNTATGFIVVVIIIVSLSLLLGVYKYVKEIKESNITNCRDAVLGLFSFFILFFL